MNDQIVIEALEVRARIGTSEAERREPQRLTAHLVIEPGRGFAEMEDRLERTVDYQTVCLAVRELAENSACVLIETLAESIVGLLIGRFAARTVEVELRKYVVAETAFTAVRLRRSAAWWVEQ